MASVEPARHAPYSDLERVLGAEHVKTLMTHLPQHRPDEVATKADIVELKADVDLRSDRMEAQVDQLTFEVREMSGVKTYTLTTVGAMTRVDCDLLPDRHSPGVSRTTNSPSRACGIRSKFYRSTCSDTLASPGSAIPE